MLHIRPAEKYCLRWFIFVAHQWVQSACRHEAILCVEGLEYLHETAVCTTVESGFHQTKLYFSFNKKKRKNKNTMPVIFNKASNNLNVALEVNIQSCTHLVAIFFIIQANTKKLNIFCFIYFIIISPVKKKDTGREWWDFLQVSKGIRIICIWLQLQWCHWGSHNVSSCELIDHCFNTKQSTQNQWKNIC